jgi:hypothetical protein
MFWGCFAGSYKEWKTINSERYCDHILTLVEQYISSHPNLTFMQDNAPSNSSKLTKEWLQQHQIDIIEWH